MLVYGFPCLSSKFYVNVFDGCSDKFSIPEGLQQSSTLSPCLYSLFTADVKVPSGTDLAQFADDASISCSGKKPKKITRALEKSLKTVSKFYYVEDPIQRSENRSHWRIKRVKPHKPTI